MTLMEMLAAITVLMILTLILAQVFYSATQASARGKGLAEVYQVARALKNVTSRDISGATPDAFVSGENGLALGTVALLPPGPYSSDIYPGTQSDATMRRMLMGGSDYLAFSSSNAATSDKAVSKVFYVLRASGEFVRIVHADTVFNDMNYLYDAQEKLGANVNNDDYVNEYEEQHVIAEGVERVKFSFLDRGAGPVSQTAANLQGVWVGTWNLAARQYLPAAVKVELQIVDHNWRTADDDAFTNRNFDPVRMQDPVNPLPEAGEMFDPDDGESFTFIIELPLGMKGPGA